jgi:hypothetical protein
MCSDIGERKIQAESVSRKTELPGRQRAIDTYTYTNTYKHTEKKKER